MYVEILFDEINDMVEKLGMFTLTNTSHKFYRKS